MNVSTSPLGAKLELRLVKTDCLKIKISLNPLLPLYDISVILQVRFAGAVELSTGKIMKNSLDILERG